VESRFEAFHASGLTELVGREEELELLLPRWSKAKTGEGQVVLLSGEPAIGKSRLTAALLESVAAEPHTRLRYFCSPQNIDAVKRCRHDLDGRNLFRPVERNNSAAERQRTSSANQISHREPGEVVMPRPGA
jgi:hypothetical protein